MVLVNSLICGLFNDVLCCSNDTIISEQRMERIRKEAAVTPIFDWRVVIGKKSSLKSKGKYQVWLVGT